MVLFLLILVLAPVLLDPLDSFTGRAWLDGYGTQWHHWFYGEWLAGRTELDPTPLLFHPWGKSMVAHTGGNLLDAALAWPLRMVAGPALGTTIWVALLLLGNAWGCWCLARALGAGRGAWLAPLLALFVPFVLEELQYGRPTQAMLLFPALCLADLVRLDRPWRPARAGLWLALTALSYWYYGLLLGVLAGLFTVVALARAHERKATLLRLVIVAAVAAVILLPAAWPLLGALRGDEVPGLLALGEGPLGDILLRTVEGDTEGLYLLAPFSGRTGALVQDDGLRFVAGTRLLGPLQWGLILAGLVAARRHRLLLAGWVLVCLLVATGPVIVVGDGFLPDPFYAAVLSASEVLRRWWWPGRAVGFLSLLAVAAGALALGGIPTPRLRQLFGVGALLLLGLGCWTQDLLPLDRWSAEHSPGLACLADAPSGAVIDLPSNTGQRNLYLQTLHGKPLFGGMPSSKAAFAPAEHRALLSGGGFLGQLYAVGDRRFSSGAAHETPDPQALLDLGFRYVLVQIQAYERPSPASGGTTSDWPRVKRHLVPLLGAPAFEDRQLALFTLGEAALACGSGELGVER